MSPTSKGNRGTYHHGNLREEAVRAAYDLVVTGGHEALTVRALADRLGVNHRALYRHFEERGALLRAVVRRGFENLRARTAREITPEDEPETRIEGFMRGYVAFALEEPNVYRLMFSRTYKELEGDPELFSAVQGLVTEARRAFAGLVPLSVPEDLRDRRLRDEVVAFWGMAHGLCNLYLSGMLRANSAEEARTFITERIAVYARARLG